MPDEMRDRVREGYENIDLSGLQPSEEDVPASERGMVDAFLDRVPPGGHIVDMGCGTGVPYDRAFVDAGFDVTGVDLVATNIDAARERVEGATFVQADFTAFDPDTAFDGLVCLFALFHVPRAEHADALAAFRGMLDDGAPMLITVGTADAAELTEEFAGEEMVWSFFDAEQNRELIRDAGFTIERTERIPDRIDGSEHLWVLATAT